MTDRNGSPASDPAVGPLATFAWFVLVVGVVAALAVGVTFVTAVWARILVDAAAAGWQWAGG